MIQGSQNMNDLLAEIERLAGLHAAEHLVYGD